MYFIELVDETDKATIGATFQDGNARARGIHHLLVESRQPSRIDEGRGMLMRVENGQRPGDVRFQRCVRRAFLDEGLEIVWDHDKLIAALIARNRERHRVLGWHRGIRIGDVADIERADVTLDGAIVEHGDDVTQDRTVAKQDALDLGDGRRPEKVAHGR